MYLVSKCSAKLTELPSRPSKSTFTPPNGAEQELMMPSLTPIMPLLRLSIQNIRSKVRHRKRLQQGTFLKRCAYLEENRNTRVPNLGCRNNIQQDQRPSRWSSPRPPLHYQTIEWLQQDQTFLFPDSRVRRDIGENGCLQKVWS